MDSDDEQDYMQDSDDDYGDYDQEDFSQEASDDDYGYEDMGEDDDEPSSRLPTAHYAILSDEDIEARQAEAVKSVASVLSVTEEEATILLRHFKWSVSRVNDEWFGDEERVRDLVGLVHPAGLETGRGRRKVSCGICFDDFSRDEMIAPRCGHLYCKDCWKGYVHSEVGEGPGCLTLRCAQPDCNAVLGDEMVLQLVDEEDRKKFLKYARRSYVEDNRMAKWCPAPGCVYSVEDLTGSSSMDVLCRCGHNFCWECVEEAHRPVDCATVNKWILKNSAESENMNWILANSKPCPKCKRPIEKNQGCMHMSCTPPCKFEFCWLCLGPWTEHGERTGGFYACNRYEAAKTEGVYDEAERRREMAKNSLEKYTHYYERWATNESSRQKALEDLRNIGDKIEILSERQSQPVSQLKFITEALQQIVECRRVLKWTYAYGYYLPDEDIAKKNFFEYSQGDAEANLERLHQCAEKDLNQFLNDDPAAPTDMTFTEFKTKLAGLTTVTRGYFDSLVRDLETGLKSVDGKAAAEAGTSKSSRSKSKGGKGKGGSSRPKSNMLDEVAYWPCERCTYANPNASIACQMCASPRPA
ncbi:hypothetical protein KFL_007140020 [Klebsormidium nitens]|uniref:RanBP-type and C3HC4-type zinc finger-containing protein 1 n=1 Tax=Klebsormidium nitens TaxID=105231 RepID=A0A1Y1INH7_KLENI|nr:hypothetical protein KFL_007140020 [Klebsormidium nitens]|eukprot:GAQ91019.1 hypothetical protein KFL_007140020 [Klebsormidium nitens]